MLILLSDVEFKDLMLILLTNADIKDFTLIMLSGADLLFLLLNAHFGDSVLIYADLF